MFYEFALTIPANTPATSPLEQTVQLSPGTISYVEIQFPRGTVGLVHVRVRRTLHQVWPTNPDGDIAAEGVNVSWSDDYDLSEPPFELTLSGYNLDDSFPHTITFRFQVVAAPTPAPPAAPDFSTPSPLETFTLP
jgi:hypothetical protein